MQRSKFQIGWFAIAVAAGIAWSSHARAWDGHFYLGAGVGLQHSPAELERFAQTNVPCFSRTNATVAIACSYSKDESSLAPSVYAGAQFNKYLAAEVGYTHLDGSYDFSLANPDFPAPTVISVEQDSNAFFLRGVASFPLSEFNTHRWLAPVSLSAVAGIARWNSEISLVADLRGAGLRRNSAEAENNGTSLTFGARVNYDVNQQVRVSLSWDRYTDLGNSSVAATQTSIPLQVDTTDVDVDVFGINLAYRFR